MGINDNCESFQSRYSNNTPQLQYSIISRDKKYFNIDFFKLKPES